MGLSLEYFKGYNLESLDGKLIWNTYLFLLLVEIVDDHSDEEVQSEKWSKDDEKYKVKVHVDVNLTDGLLTNLSEKICFTHWIRLSLQYKKAFWYE